MTSSYKNGFRISITHQRGNSIQNLRLTSVWNPLKLDLENLIDFIFANFALVTLNFRSKRADRIEFQKLKENVSFVRLVLGMSIIT